MSGTKIGPVGPVRPVDPIIRDDVYGGEAGFLPLDYGSRYEYSVILIPDTWESMFQLIKEPAVFMRKARTSFLETPKFNRKTIEWWLKSPITIFLEPITFSTPPTWETLKLLGLAGPVKAMLDKEPRLKFRDALYAKAKAKWPSRVDKHGKFLGLYVVEFALGTRNLTIRYLAPEVPRNPRRYTRFCTAATLSKIGTTSLNFLHFDVDFGKKRTFEAVASARAELAMDYIEDPGVLKNSWLVGSNINLRANTGSAPLHPGAGISTKIRGHKTGWLSSGGSLIQAGPTVKLSQAPLNEVTNIPPWQGEKDPTVVIDSVWPDWRSPVFHEYVKGLTTQSVPPPSEAPMLCVKVIADDGTVTYSSVGIKYYIPPEVMQQGDGGGAVVGF